MTETKGRHRTEDVAGGGSLPSNLGKATNLAGEITNKGLSHLLLIAVLAIATFVSYKSGLSNMFTDWDDKGYITNNPLIRDLSFIGIEDIFLTPVMGNYHPITILTYAIEYNMVELAPWQYHLDNILLHIMVVVAVYFLVFLLAKNKLTALVTAGLFGLHPMHAESVAWVAGRKDVLCALFYFSACVSYVCYVRDINKKRSLWYFITMVLFVAAILSKPIAVILPVTLLLIDLYEGRKWRVMVFLEKAPHFVLSTVFGLLSFSIQQGGGAMAVHKETYNIAERLALGAYALTTYLWKLLLPINLHALYLYPQKVNGSLPAVYYLFIVLTAGAGFAIWKWARNKKDVVFGALFFIANILLLLQFIPVGDAIVAERYTYIPYFGLFFIVGSFATTFMAGPRRSQVKYLTLIALFFAMGYVTSQRCKVWYNGFTLWTDEMIKVPRGVPLANNNLGFYYFEKQAVSKAEQVADHDSAIYFLTRAVLLQPDLANAHEGLGILYYSDARFDSAAHYFRNLIKYQPSAESFYDLGAVMYAMGQADSAVTQYSKALAVDSNHEKSLVNRAIIYKEQDRWPDALNDLNKVIGINPQSGVAYYHRSFCDTQSGNWNIARKDVETAFSLGFRQIDKKYFELLNRK